MPPSPTIPPPSTESLDAGRMRGAHGLTRFCRPCSRSKSVTIERAIEIWGHGATPATIQQRTHCHLCKRPPTEVSIDVHDPAQCRPNAPYYKPL